MIICNMWGIGESGTLFCVMFVICPDGDADVPVRGHIPNEVFYAMLLTGQSQFLNT